MVLGLLVAVAACSDTDGAEDLRGDTVEVVAVWQDTEQARFQRVLRAFERRTGATVRYTPTRGADIATVLDERVASDRPPDVAVLPQPGLLRRYARQGVIHPLDEETAREIRARYAPIWRRLGTVDGDPYAVWFKAANKSLIWYHLGAFERAGVVPPDDIDGLLDLAGMLAGSAVPVFSVAASVSDAWTLTDWFENVYLRVAGPRQYDALSRHRLAWTDTTVQESLRLLARLLAPELVAGGPSRALATSFPDSVAAVFARVPSAAMVFEGDFVAGVATGRGDGELGVDVDVFPFPERDGARRLVVGGGDAAVLMRPTRGGRALLRFLATPAAAEVWAAQGGFISPNEDVDLAVYPDQTTRTIARRVLEAGDGFRFDLSDLQPVAFGGTTGQGMYRILREFLADPSDVARTAQRLEEAADAAYVGAGVSGG